jgi:hypothetical protein
VKSLLLGLLCLLATALTLAQVDPVAGLHSADAESQRIEAERARQNAVFDGQAAACYQRFAVNACLSQVESGRRAVLTDLKRQEAILHDSQRLQKGAEQLRLTEKKGAERKQKELDAQAEDGAATAREKQQAQQDKKARHAAKASGHDAKAPNAPTGPNASQQAEYRDGYARKQAEAEKKRQEVARRLKEKSSAPALPLPLPK